MACLIVFSQQVVPLSTVLLRVVISILCCVTGIQWKKGTTGSHLTLCCTSECSESVRRPTDSGLHSLATLPLRHDTQRLIALLSELTILLILAFPRHADIMFSPPATPTCHQQSPEFGLVTDSHNLPATHALPPPSTRARFLSSSPEVRNKMLKLIPHIADGSWMIKQSVGTTPVILGKVRAGVGAE